jgi:hypothetical protein
MKPDQKFAARLIFGTSLGTQALAESNLALGTPVNRGGVRCPLIGGSPERRQRQLPYLGRHRQGAVTTLPRQPKQHLQEEAQ